MTSASASSAHVSPSLFTTPFSTIEVEEGFNLRPELTEIPELAKLIEVNGGPRNITPIVVEKKGENGSTAYVITSGHRRYAALQLLKVPGKTEIPVQLKEFADVVERALENIVENTGRQDVHPRFMAKRLYELRNGYLPGATFGVQVKKLAERTGLAVSTVQNLIRCEKNLADEIKEAWFKKNIPFSIVLGWAGLEHDAQNVALEEWLEEQKALAESGRKRRIGKGGEGGGGRGSKDEDEEEDEPAKRSVTDMRAKLEALSERTELTEKQTGMVSALKWCLGMVEILR